MKKNRKVILSLVLLNWLLQTLFVLLFKQQLLTPLPQHFGLNGQPDGWFTTGTSLTNALGLLLILNFAGLIFVNLKFLGQNRWAILNTVVGKLCLNWFISWFIVTCWLVEFGFFTFGVGWSANLQVLFDLTMLVGLFFQISRKKHKEVR
ncbi:hypothetical protein [Liquorilactobacillus sicerae]|uniref:hypothetical protein n=1 Tax=Liquorilactobacillus sicerae TaxID=1416943 RepID=UPI00248076F9|nr:hypothetical protein [Liquorilactobacillus sicerae]